MKRLKFVNDGEKNYVYVSKGDKTLGMIVYHWHYLYKCWVWEQFDDVSLRIDDMKKIIRYMQNIGDPKINKR